MRKKDTNDFSISQIEAEEMTSYANNGNLSEMTDNVLAEIHSEIEKGDAFTVPIVQL